MELFAIQYIHGKPTPGVDEADLPWEPTPGEPLRLTEAEAQFAADLLVTYTDGLYTFRVVPVTLEPPSLAKTEPRQAREESRKQAAS